MLLTKDSLKYALPMDRFDSHLTSLISEKAELPPAPLAPAHIISPPVSVYSKSRSPEPSITRSNLSSPFVEKLRLPNDYDSHASERRLQHATELLTPQPKLSLANATSLFSPVRITEKRPASTQSEVPTPPPVVALPEFVAGETNRPPGGEIDRIRAHASLLQQARETELENRRPEYFKRLKRSADEPLPSSEVEPGPSSTGILTSPVKGRRIQLFDAFQETSEASFEESLMTNGYGMYGEPRTPQRQANSLEGPSQATAKWLEHTTPAGPSTFSLFSDNDKKPDEKELKKRRRLEAFAASTSWRTAKLIPAVVEGIGRVIVPPEGVEELLPSIPLKKRATGRKKKGTGLASPVDNDKKGKGLVRLEELDEPKWLDNEFPWALRGKEREEEQKEITTKKLQRIERYLSRDSDSEGSERDPNDEELLPSSTWGQEYEDPPVATRRGRGKAVPLRPNPARAQTPSAKSDTSPLSMRKSKSVFLPSDPADARAALLSKRSVRMFAQRRFRRSSSWMGVRSDSDDGQFACPCGMNGHGDDGKPAVECSQCKFWYHFECIGIKDESELGDEDDTWFCSEACRGAYLTASMPESDPSSPKNLRQPTFAPTDERPPPSLARGDVAFYSSSPLRPWGSSSALETPLRAPYRGQEGEVRRSLWDDVNLQTPTGPSSPLPGLRNIRVTTPGSLRYDFSGVGEDMGFAAFDPMGTPSRGFKLAPGLFATPKQPSFNPNQGQNSSASGNVATGGGFPGPSWASRAGGMFATPTPRTRHLMPGSTGLNSLGLGVDGFARGNAGLAMYAMDDTPIRREPLVREVPRPSLMSIRAHSPTQLQMERGSPESPSPRVQERTVVRDAGE